MARRASRRPTEAELEILQVLWQHGPSTVRGVNDVLKGTKPTGYTTTLKLMQIMLEKGLLKRDESQRPQVYRPVLGKGRTQRQLVGDLLQRAFDGSAGQLVLQVLSSKKASPKEMAEIRRLLRRLEGEKQ